jgi:hypothetical protein
VLIYLTDLLLSDNHRVWIFLLYLKFQEKNIVLISFSKLDKAYDLLILITLDTLSTVHYYIVKVEELRALHPAYNIFSL